MILMVIDTQELLMNNEIYQFDIFSKNIEELIFTARENNIEVIYVVHDDGIDSELTKGKKGFEIFAQFAPKQDDQIFIKEVNSAFRNTGLLEYLYEKNQTNIVVVGLQTDKCVDATIKVGFEYGFNMIVPKDANSTIDNEYIDGKTSHNYYNDFMWNTRYAECISVEETIIRMESINDNV